MSTPRGYSRPTTSRTALEEPLSVSAWTLPSPPPLALSRRVPRWSPPGAIGLTEACSSTGADLVHPPPLPPTVQRPPAPDARTVNARLELRRLPKTCRALEPTRPTGFSPHLPNRLPRLLDHETLREAPDRQTFHFHDNIRPIATPLGLDMATADAIRAYAIQHYIAPARAAGRDEVGIRLGDIRNAMKLTNPLQSVRSALGTRLFQDIAGVELLEPIQPRASAATCCRFRIRSSPSK